MERQVSRLLVGAASLAGMLLFTCPALAVTYERIPIDVDYSNVQYAGNGNIATKVKFYDTSYFDHLAVSHLWVDFYFTTYPGEMTASACATSYLAGC